MAQKNPNILNILKLRHGIKVLEQINAMACKTRHYGISIVLKTDLNGTSAYKIKHFKTHIV